MWRLFASRSSSLAVLVATLAGVLAGATAAPAQTEVLTPAQWEADLDALVAHVRNVHRKPFHTLSEAEFETRVRDLRERLGDLPPRSIVLRMARLVSAIGDGHTRLSLPLDTNHLGYRLQHRRDPPPHPAVPRFGVLPLRFRLLADGVYVVATVRAEDLLGARLVRVGEASTEDAVRAVEPWMPADTPSGRRHTAVLHLAVPALLVEAGVVAAERRVPLTFELEDGTTATRQVTPLDPAAQPTWTSLSTSPEPAEGPFEIRSLQDADALLVRLDEVQDQVPGTTLGQFGRELAAALEARKPQKVLLDLRANHGGNSTLSRAIVLPLVRWEGSSTYGRLYTLVGPETFSAAVDMMGDLEQWTQNITVGSEPGSGPTSYSDADREELPESGLVVRVSTSYRVAWTGGEQRTRYEIDLPMQQDIGSLRGGRDAVVEHALSHVAGADLAAQMVRAHQNGGINSALFVGFRSRTDPRTADASTEDAMNRLGWHLLEAEEDRFAAGVFLFNRENYPESVEAHRGEAEARLRLGALDEAQRLVEAALELEPTSAELKALRARMAQESGAIEP